MFLLSCVFLAIPCFTSFFLAVLCVSVCWPLAVLCVCSLFFTSIMLLFLQPFGCSSFWFYLHDGSCRYCCSFPLPFSLPFSLLLSLSLPTSSHTVHRWSVQQAISQVPGCAQIIWEDTRQTEEERPNKNQVWLWTKAGEETWNGYCSCVVIVRNVSLP